MSELLSRFDSWLKDDGPAALVLREQLMPVEGEDGVIFPPTFAAGDDFRGGYNIDILGDGTNVCILDTFGSQANRIEPLFAAGPFKSLVPQVIIKAGEKQVNLLEAGHRAGDAVVRCTSLQQELHKAFRALLTGDALPLARLAPTSLIFGVWDSRDTQAKAPRLLASTIRAFNVRPLTRSAQYVPAVDYVGEGILEEPENLKTEQGKVKTQHPFAQRGFTHVPATGTHGGVIAAGGIRRDATLHLAALRMLRTGSNGGAMRAEGAVEPTLKLQRYLLGLALVSFTHPSATYLRQGCNLVRKTGTAVDVRLVFSDGTRLDADVGGALAYATGAAGDFSVDATPREVSFDSDKAKLDLAGSGEGKSKPGGRAKK